MRLEELRKTKNQTQKSMAKILNIPYHNYNKYELNQTEPNLETLIKIADFYKISLDYLVERKQDYMLDISNISQIKQNLINLILSQTDRTCERLEAMIFGYLNSYEETRLRMQHNYFNKKD